MMAEQTDCQTTDEQIWQSIYQPLLSGTAIRTQLWGRFQRPAVKQGDLYADLIGWGGYVSLTETIIPTLFHYLDAEEGEVEL